jgi:hypothetical protein
MRCLKHEVLRGNDLYEFIRHLHTNVTFAVKTVSCNTS